VIKNIRTHIGPGPDETRPLPKHLTKKEFGRRVYALMMQKRWSQSDLARAAEMPRDAISTYVRGISLPSPRSLAKLATALGVAQDDLLPNYVEAAIDHDNPSLDLKVSPNRPNEAWLRIDQRVSLPTALKITELLQNDTLEGK
jgi:transcriptional regulator with XRE-family HTH domain